MERYVKGRSRFILATLGGQPGYAVFRLDGRLRDHNLTPVYKGIRTRRSAERVARKLADGGLVATNVRFYRTFDQARLAKSQDGMRRRNGHAPAPVAVAPTVPVEQEKHFDMSEIAKLGWAGSIWSVRRRFAKLPGVTRQFSASGRVTMTVPASVLKAYHESLTRRDR